MKHTTKTVAGIAALIGATAVITTPVPAGATDSTPLGLCLAIDDEPRCDIVRPPLGGGPGTAPTVIVIDELSNADPSSGCVQVGHVQACAG